MGTYMVGDTWKHIRVALEMIKNEISLPEIERILMIL